MASAGPVVAGKDGNLYTYSSIDPEQMTSSLGSVLNRQAGLGREYQGLQLVGPAGGAANNAAKTNSSQFDWSKAIDDYANSGFAQDLLPDSFYGDAVNQTATQQGSALLGALSQGRANGQLSGAGFDAAMGNYNTQYGQAQSDIGGIASGIQAGNRQSLYDVLNTARSDLDKMLDKSQFSLDPYKQQISDKANELKGNFGSDLEKAIAGQSYFSQAPAFSAALPVQGAYNRPSNGLVSALEKNNANTTGRGLGNGGEF